MEVITLVDRCVCCGEIVPEGRQICLDCENKIDRGGRRTSGSRSVWRWIHDICMVAGSRDHNRRVCRNAPDRDRNGR